MQFRLISIPLGGSHRRNHGGSVFYDLSHMNVDMSRPRLSIMAGSSSKLI